VQRFTPSLIDAARPCRHACGDRWFVDVMIVLQCPASFSDRATLFAGLGHE
jgi:hypothetical protein